MAKSKAKEKEVKKENLSKGTVTEPLVADKVPTGAVPLGAQSVVPNQGTPATTPAVPAVDKVMTPLEIAKAKAAKIVADAEAVDAEQKKLNKDFKSAKETVFVSQFAEHLIRVEPIDVQVDNMGRKRIINRGSTIQFHNKIYRTSDPKEIEAIEKNPAFGSIINVAKVAPEQIKKEVATQIST